MLYDGISSLNSSGADDVASAASKTFLPTGSLNTKAATLLFATATRWCGKVKPQPRDRGTARNHVATGTDAERFVTHHPAKPSGGPP
jgi:hypothetical protein